VPIALNCTCPLVEVCASAAAGVITIDCSTLFDIEFIELQPTVVIAKAANQQIESGVGILEHCMPILLAEAYDFAKALLVKSKSIYCKVIAVLGALDAAPKQ
jgi:hypothetical protein